MMKSSVKNQIPSMSCPATYRIRIKGQLDASWSDRLAGMTLTISGGKDTPNMTVLEGRLKDQTALTGVLNTLYDLQLPLLSVDCLDCRDIIQKGGSS